MSHRASIALLVLLASGACKSGDKEAKLPPASGPNAPPRAPLPALGNPSAPATKIAQVAQATTGTTYPNARAAVAPRMSGVIAEVLVDEGDRVSKRTVLFRLRTEDVSLRVNQARAGLNAAKVRLAAVKVEYERTKQLFENKAINQMAWDKVQAEYQAARVGVQAATAALRLAQQGWSDAVVRSPINGIVTKKLKNAGEMATMIPPSPVVVVEDHSSLELKFRLPEQALKTLAISDVFSAEFSAIGITKKAKVIRIAPSVDSHTRTVEVVAKIDNASGKLKSGMLAEVVRKGAAPVEAAKKAGAGAGK